MSQGLGETELFFSFYYVSCELAINNAVFGNSNHKKSPH